MQAQFLIDINNPILKNHKVYGQEILPGLAYIDMLYQIFRENGYDYSRLSLQNLTIYSPLIVGQDYSVLVGILCSEIKDGQWRIRVEGQEQRRGITTPDKKLYITAEMCVTDPVAFNETLDLKRLKQSAERIADLDEAYRQYRSHDLVHTGFIKAEGTVYDTETMKVVDISVGKDALPSAEDFIFHPTLIDGSAIGSWSVFDSLVKGEEKVYIPLFYESFRASALLQKRCVARVQTSSVRQKNDLLYMTMEFFDDFGQKVGELKNLIIKRVREEGLINPNRRTVREPADACPSIEISSIHSNRTIDCLTTVNTVSSGKAEDFIRELMADRLRLPASKIDIHTGYYEMGLDSPGLLEIVQAIENKTGASLSPTLLFEYVTIAELAAYLTDTYPGLFGELPAAEQAETPGVEINGEVFQRDMTVERTAGTVPEIQEDIAVIGMACRYPGASNPQEFWELLKDGKDLVTEVPGSRWNWRQLEGVKSPSGKNMSRWGGFIDDPDCFDPQFFRISPREAELMDPQERLFLETCWEAIEEAGYTPGTLVPPRGPSKRRNVGVFAGIMHKDYTLIEAEAVSQGQSFVLSLNCAQIANRVSYFCNFHGPSMAVDTVCSSSLTAVHLALESIRHGECEVALAGGVNLSLHPIKYLSVGMIDMHSSDGYCHTFGKGGDGYVSGEGIGVVLLKPLHKAIQDKDHIYAVIKGSSVNHVGTVSGITVPSPVAQGDMISQCLKKTGINPRTISYMEAHGTGTSLGDPIEIQGLVKAYRQYTQDVQFCSIGSVKSNIGHAESAAGISGLHKVILQLYHKTLVPSLHSEELNPYLNLEQSPFYVQHQTEEWKQPVILEDGREVVYPRRAGISSFGATGSNAHVILEEYIPEEMQQLTAENLSTKAGTVIIPLSAKNEERLQAYAVKLVEFLTEMDFGRKPQQDKKEKILRAALEAKIREIFSGTVQIQEEQIEVGQEWNEYGVEPVQITQVKEKIQEVLNVEINATELNQRSSVASIVDFLISHHGDVLKTRDSLFAQAEMAARTESREPGINPCRTEAGLRELAYTLQIGREAMETRVAFLAKDIPELVEKLQGFIKGDGTVENCWKGHVKQNKEIIDFIGTDQDSLELIHKWILKGNVRKIAELWTKGCAVDWELFYGKSKPQRRSLPTYPFAKERYWVPETEASLRGAKTIPAGAAFIHPLIHRNTSDFYEQRYSSEFSGQEFFLADHAVKGQHVMPGAAYLEMARAAVAQAAGALVEDGISMRLKNVVWARPIVAGEQPVHVHVALCPEDNGEISYEVYSTSGGDAGPVVHSQGFAVMSRITEVPVLDLKELQAQNSLSTLSSAQCYEMFRAMGLEYGEAHKGIEKIYLGKGQVLAMLSLPSCVSETRSQFVLHPSLMDAALQSTIALGIDPENPMSSESKNNLKPSMPFELQEVEILGPCSPQMWAAVRYGSGNTANDPVKKCDIDVCDETGKVCVRMKGFSARKLEEKLHSVHASGAVPAGSPNEPPVGSILMTPVWDRVSLEKGQRSPKSTERIVIAGGTGEHRSLIREHYPAAHVLDIRPESTVDGIAEMMETCGSIDHMVWIAPYHPVVSAMEETIIEEQDRGVLELFRIIKAMLRLGYGTRDLSWSVVTLQAQPIHKDDSVNPTHASIHGLTGSLAKEYAQWKIRLVDMDADCTWPMDNIFSLPFDRTGHAWAYRNGQWYRQQLIPLQLSPVNQTSYRRQGVYVVIGGAGDIGEIWSEYMIRTYQANIVWIGRRNKDAAIQSKLDRLAALGNAPYYISADATDQKSLQSAYEEIKEHYPRIHGVVHSAMALSDHSLDRMDETQFRKVLATKVDVSVRMAQVFRNEPLDFVLLFSSIIAFIKNPGQSNYASGCTFKDAYAHLLSREWPCNVKVMNWGFWYKEESAAPETYQIYLRLTQIGMGAIEPPEAMQALEILLSGPMDQIALTKTTKPLILEGMNPEEVIIAGENGKAVRQRRYHKPGAVSVKQVGVTPAEEKKTSQVQVGVITQELLREKTTALIKNLVGETLKIPSNKIDSSEPLEKYGIDSIVVIQLANALRKTLDNINTTLFFEYQTIDALVEHFLKTRKDALVALLGLEEREADVEVPVKDEPCTLPSSAFLNPASRRNRRFVQAGLQAERAEPAASKVQDIAIIGVSGRYAGANNVHEFWNNLKEARNCITEIPKDRWDWKKYFNEEKGRKGSMYTRWGGFIEEIDKFDPLFFQISPREAENMDPQERLFLEAAYECIEDAGYTPANLCDHRKIGVFAGVMYGHYPTGAKYWSIANRISYLFNFQGPSLAVDTACSSSLTAIHLALESLYSGSCECAIAGGVNLITSPEHYLGLSEMTMLSPGDRCKAFGDQADGFVDGEGVGAIVLKPLAKAVEDDDHIYGVIKGSMLNAAGKTNGYTVPNPNAQSNLIAEALRRAKVHPRTVSYLEAHGTGTSLGDPIEIAGLTKAFEQFTHDKQFCAIGSAKSNIGHCESAAGIAAVTKVLLQLKYGQLVPSLHSKTLNSNIDFKDTPFVVQQELTEWERPVVDIGGETREYPRIAGISSFGAGGSNVHVVIEEYLPENREKPRRIVSAQRPALIVLSARNEERLKVRVQQLLAAITERQFTDENLADIAYTLQVGREAMEERLALIAGSVRELEEKLEYFLEGRENITDLYRGQAKSNKEVLTVFTADEDMAKTVEAWIDKGRYGRILDLWVKGLVFDWNKLYSNTRPGRISLPTYPFARERYWLQEAGTQFPVSGRLPEAAADTFIHPLLHQNTSDLVEQRYSSTFTGKEFFLAEHVVKGQHVLPGVACLEMARAAVEHAAGAMKDGHMRICLRNIVWAQPMVAANHPVKAHIALFPEDNGEIAYEIYSGSEEDRCGVTVHSQGSAVLRKEAELLSMELETLQAECCQGILSSTECYEAFRTMGIEYGPAHQGIEEIYMGTGQVLARLSLPSSVADTCDRFVLHPSIMDSAIQSSIGLMMGSGYLKPALPFAMKELQVLDRCAPAMWALIRYSRDCNAWDRVPRFDIDLCDDTGAVCVRMKEFSIRVIEDKTSPEETPETPGVLMVEPSWKEQAAVHKVTAAAYTHHLVVLCEFDRVSVEDIKARMHGVRCLNMQSVQESVGERFQIYAGQLFSEIQNILRARPDGPVLIQVVTGTQGEEQIFSGLFAMLRTAQLENPKIIGQLIEMSAVEDTEEIIQRLEENSRNPENKHIRYQSGKRYVREWKEIEVFDEKTVIPWKRKGVYLITGGAGGLGLIFAKEIARQVKDVTLVLTGRSPLSQDRKAKLKELESLGAQIEYRQVDVTDKEACGELIQGILDEFGSLNGIIHGAGVIKDNFIIKKSENELLEVLAPKVAGLVNLDQASKDINLDFFVLFSSIAGGLGNPGQADYAAANAFMDAYARYRNSLITSKRRQGKTLSVNWSLWKEGTMRVDQETQKMMMLSIGTSPIQSSNGIRAFYQSWASGRDQIMVMEGKLERLHKTLFEDKSGMDGLEPFHGLDKNKETEGVSQDLLEEKTINYFKNLLSSVISLPPSRIEPDAPMENYGINSIMVMQLTNQLEKTFGSLPKTLFFEYQSIQEITRYFVKSYRSRLVELFGLEQKVATAAGSLNDSIISAKPTDSVVTSRRRQRFASKPAEPKEKAAEALDIAIIGVSGRYPGAENIREFWKNLQAGRDCITEIPKDRWDHHTFFDEDRNKPGKTYSKWGGFLGNVDRFDPQFFNISPREAETLDPQERLFLECVYETMEDAGYTRETLGMQKGSGMGGNVGVYVGVMYEEYQLYGAQETLEGRPVALGGSPSSIANRVSYFCNFHGPSLAVDTMCSSSLTTIHLACQGIQRGDCEMAVAGGVNISIHPNKYLVLAQGKFASSKGRCESFGEGGDGYVPGEGVGAVLLKPLSKAVADGDQIYGVIKGTSVNHGGKTNGFTVPNPNAQAHVIKRALKEAGIHPRTISYLEAHGTGTSLGDPIEIAGLTKTFEEYTSDKQFCAIGSVKSNIGHCESAAGIAAVTKVLLQLKYRQLVPSLHSNTLNPNIDFEDTPFVVQQELTEWKRPVVNIGGESKEYPRIAGISSFGAGGSNAHIVIEEYISGGPALTQAASGPQHPAIVVLSARNDERLKAQVQQLLDFIRECRFTDAALADMAYTLQVGREAMEERLAVIAGSLQELEEKLACYMEGRNDIPDFYRGQVKPNKETLALFTGDEELKEAIDKWIQRKKYAKLLNLWVKGLVLDWNKFYGNIKPRRISLPTYPFARDRYWAPGGKVKASIEKIETPAVVQKPGIRLSADLGKSGAEIKNAPRHEIKERSISLQPLQTEPEVKSSIPERQPTVSLRPLSEGVVLPDKLQARTDWLITLPPANITLPGNSQGGNFEPEGNTQTPVTVETLQEELAISLAEALYMKQSDIDMDEKFIDMGLDSITGVEWIQGINKKYGIPISATKVYDYPTIREFAGFLEKELAKQGGHVQSSLPSPASSQSVPDDLPPSVTLKTVPGEPASQLSALQDQPGQEQQSSLRDALQEELAESLAEALYMKQSDIDADEKFIDLGLDSITGVEWIQGINKKYGVSVSATKVYDYPTIYEFAGLLEKLLQEQRGEEGHAQLKAVPSLSFDEILQQVQSGKMDIEQADQLLKQLSFEEEQDLQPMDSDEPEDDTPAPVTAEVLQEELAISLAEVLYMKQSDIDVDEKFIDMGLDSITGVEWIQGINKKYGVSVSATKVYDYPTIREFAGFLEKELE